MSLCNGTDALVQSPLTTTPHSRNSTGTSQTGLASSATSPRTRPSGQTRSGI